MRKLMVNTEELLDEVVALINQGHTATIKVKGDSMLPFLNGDKDMVVLAKAEQIKKYDIVLIKQERQYILHRIVEIEQSRVVLMGDGNFLGREQCCREDILAKAIVRIRDGEKIKFGRVAPIIWFRLLPLRRYLLYILRRLK